MMNKNEKNLKLYTCFAAGVMLSVVALYLLYLTFSVISLILFLAECALLVYFSKNKQAFHKNATISVCALSVAAFLYAIFDMRDHMSVGLTSLGGVFFISFILRLMSTTQKDRERTEDRFFGKDKDILGFHTEMYKEAYDELWNRTELASRCLACFALPPAIVTVFAFFDDIWSWLSGIVALSLMFIITTLYLVYMRRLQRKVFSPIEEFEKEELKKQIYNENNYGKWNR